MMTSNRNILACLVLACATALPAMGGAHEPPVGLGAIADIDALWLYNGKTETAMISSAHPGGGNLDFSNFQGKYRGEKILAEIEGPGAVYRIWSAAPSGQFKAYLDGADKPEISCPFKKYLEGECKGLPPDFTAGRFANYMPIPFKESIVITAPGFHLPGYYQVSYQTYDDSVPVRSFSMERVSRDPDLGAAQLVWASGGAPLCACDLKQESGRAAVAPGGEADALTFEGRGVIRNLKINNPGDFDDPLADVELLIYWDGEEEPSVRAPMDAFFINRFDLKDHWPGGRLRSAFVAAHGGGYDSFFPMPFSKSARVAVVNNGGAEVTVQAIVGWEPMPGLPGDAMRFHAAYNEQNYETDLSPERTITSKTPVDPASNYVVLGRAGRGHYIGCAIFVESVGTIWWGEGDEMTYVDGSAEPAIRGTGTEDEFNWSWGFEPHMSIISGTLPVVPECDENIAAQIVPALRNPECNDIRGENIAYRFRISDYVPFSESIKVTYEVLGVAWSAPNSLAEGNWSQHRGDDYASIAYWYEQ